jgi:serine/threonine protein phosphatase PrpC
MENIDSPSGLGSIFCVVTVTNKDNASENQDYGVTAKNQAVPMSAMIIADGLGSFEYAELAAREVVEFVRGQIENAVPEDAPDPSVLFHHAKTHLVEFANQFSEEKKISLDRARSFGTTLIAGLETITHLTLGYAGNGGIWHLRGNFNHFHESKYLPWNAVNYLNPHSVQGSAGKEELYRLLSLADDTDEAVPSVFRMEKDESYFGDIILICTDGIYSSDQVPVGKAGDGSLWISAEKIMPLFYDHLNAYFAGPGEWTDQTLEKAMQEYLNTLKEQKLLEDDATLGVLITAKTLAYQQKFRKHHPADT